MAKGAEAGKAFLAGVLAKVPADQRAEAERIFNLAEVATAVGDGTLAQAELSRQLDELRTKDQALADQTAALATRETQLNDWYQGLTGWKDENEALLKLGKEAKAKGFDPATATRVTPTGKEGEMAGLTKDELTAVITQEREAYLGYDLEKNKLQQDHFKTFGTLLDIEPLLRHPEISKVGLVGVYQLVHKDALEAKSKATAEAAEAKIRLDERNKVLAERGTQLPYPTPSGVGSGSPLDAIKPAGAGDSLVDQATAEYHRLQSVRSGAST